MHACLVMFDSMSPGTIAHQAPVSMGIPRQEYWSGEPFPSPGDLPDWGTKPSSPVFPTQTLYHSLCLGSINNVQIDKALRKQLYQNCRMSNLIFLNYKTRLTKIKLIWLRHFELPNFPCSMGTSLATADKIIKQKLIYKKLNDISADEEMVILIMYILSIWLCSFPRQTIQYHSYPSLCPNQ